MKKTIQIILPLLFALLVLLSNSALADGVKPYAGFSWRVITYDESGYDTAEFWEPGFHGGVLFNNYIAADARFGFGIDDDKVYVGEPIYDDVKIELDYFFGVYAKARLPLKRFVPYLIAGMTKVKYTASVANISASDDDTGLSYGIGLDVFALEALSISAEYIVVIDKSGFEQNDIAFGLNYYF